MAAETTERSNIIAWFETGILAEENRFAASFESCQIVKRDGRFFFRYVDDSSIVPMPICTLRAEGFLDRLVIDEDLKSSGRSGCVPWCDPVPGAHPDAVLARGGEGDVGYRFLDGDSQAVREQVGGTHLIHGLLVKFPASAVVKAFCFNEKEIVCLWRGLLC